MQNRHMARRRAGIVGDERLVVVGGRPDDGDGFQGVFIQRQDVLVIFEQDDAPPRAFESQLAMCFAFNDFWRRSIAVVIKHAQTEFHIQLMPKHRVQRLFRDLALRIGGFAAVLPMEVRNHIDAGLQFLF